MEPTPSPASQPAPENLHATANRPARRRWILAALGAAILVLLVVLGVPGIGSILSPLPKKRFVALMAWAAEPDAQRRLLIGQVLDRVEDRISRAEAGSDNLMAILPADVPGQLPPKAPADAIALGANLVLAASAKPEKGRLVLTLQVLDAATARVLRQSDVSAAPPEENGLPESGAKSAAKLLGASLASDSTPSPRSLLVKARALRRAGKRVEEEEAWRALVKMRPNYWPAYLELGRTLSDEGKDEKAAPIFAEGSALAPRVPVLLTNLGATYLRMDRKPDAEYVLQKSLERGPSVFAYTSLGALAFGLGDAHKALDYLLKAREMDPSLDTTWRSIGDCYAVLGDPARMDESYRKAAELLGAALRADPQSAASWMTLALYQAKLRMPADARQSMANAEARGADDLRVRFIKSQALALIGQKDEAVRLVVDCLVQGLPPSEAEGALELKEVRADPRYKEQLEKLGSKQ
jgi:tetratricopeptide (TPR) repeat protein